MELLLKEKVVFVTASAHGLGKGIAKGFLEEGAYVVINGISQERVNRTLREFEETYGDHRVLAYNGDLTKNSQIKQCVKEIISRFGRIDVLVGNLGSGRGATEWQISEEDWATMMDLNFNGARRVTNEVAPYMIQNNCGSIIFISSISGREVIGAPIHYSVAKAAVTAFAKNLSFRLAGNNIRVNTICPGNIYFENGTWDKKMKENPQGVNEMLKNRVPLQRFANPEEIANLVLFISSNKAGFITGSCIIADGGQTISI